MAEPDDEDLTGKRRLGWNVTITWLGQIVVVISGFLIPRLIDRQLSQEALGIWDFAWSTVAYFRMLGLGLAGGLNRYVAYYRARQSPDELARVIASASFLQVLVASATILAAIGVGRAAQWFLTDGSAQLADSGQWLISLLGGGLAIKMLCWPARGVLTGYHRWSTTSAITAFGDILLLFLMIANLYTGGGLAALGLAYVGSTVVTETLRVYFARRLHGARFLVWSNLDRKMTRELVVFGVKANVSGLPILIVVQSASLILASVSGPAALAVYARPLALTRYVQTIVLKFANILTSTTAGLKGLGRDSEIREFFLQGTRAAFAISVPLLLVVAFYGDVMVRVWMGDDYVDPFLAPLLAAGMLMPYANAAAMQVLTGLNAHGRAAALSLASSSLVLAAGVAVVFALGWTPRSTAVLVGASLTAGPGLVVPFMACRLLRVPVAQYVRRALILPAISGTLLGGFFAMHRLRVPQPSVTESTIAILMAGIVLSLVYWCFLLERDTRDGLLRRLNLRTAPIDASGD